MIPLVKPIFGKKEKQLINEVIDSGIVASGKYVEDFEKRFAKLSKAKFGAVCSNGTTALNSALLACGIKTGDKVITTPFTFIATANSILYCGATPIFADINPETYNIDPKSVEEILKKEKNQAHLAKYKGKTVGAIADAGAFSFYATKNMTTGEGGIVLTNNPKINFLAKKIINHGRTAHYEHDMLGYNFRLTNICAAMGLAQCDHIEEWTKQRILNAKKLSDGLKDLDFLVTPVTPKKYTHVFHQYTLRIKKGLRNKFMQYLKDNGIGCGIHYPEVIYKQPLYKKLGYKKGLCPIAEQAVKEVISIPVHPSLTNKDTDTIIEVIKGFKK